MITKFLFVPGQRFSDPVISDEFYLRLESVHPAAPMPGYVPSYSFSMRHKQVRGALGEISFRIGSNDHLNLYAGHIGYGVRKPHRGNGYAAMSCRLLRPVIRAHGFAKVIITCDPDNFASSHSCRKAGAVYLEEVEVPPGTRAYREGMRRKERWEFWA
jgi:tagatose 1,6-diphosphate aldolase